MADVRRMPRTVTKLPALLDGVEGVVLDTNPWGVFFAPSGYLKRSVGRLVRLGLNATVSLIASVRWEGWSTRHGCLGFGLNYVAVVSDG